MNSEFRFNAKSANIISWKVVDGLPKSCIIYYILGAVNNTFPDEFAMYSPSRALDNYDVVMYGVLDYLLESLGAVIKVLFSNSLKRKHFSPSSLNFIIMRFLYLLSFLSDSLLL